MASSTLLKATIFLVLAVTLALALPAVQHRISGISQMEEHGRRFKRQETESTGANVIPQLRSALGPLKEVDVVLAMDRSRGINKETFYRDSKKLARAILLQYASIHPDYARVSVITFAKDVTLVLDGIRSSELHPTKYALFGGGNDSPWERDVRFVQNTSLTGDTNIRDALQLASRLFQDSPRQSASRVVILITDGSYEGFNDPEEQANELKMNKSATIYGVGVGNWLKIGNVRDLTSKVSPASGGLAEPLYGGFGEWQKLLREAVPSHDLVSYRAGKHSFGGLTYCRDAVLKCTNHANLFTV